MAVLTAAVVAAMAASYVVGRCRPGLRLLSWAEDHAHGGWRNPANWAAQGIFAVALAWMWTIRPRRTLANVRSWREAERREQEARSAPPIRVCRTTPTIEEPTP